VFPLGRFILHHDERALGASRVPLNSIAPMKSLPVINPNAAAVDVGSEQLHLSIAGDAPVVFGTFTDEVYRLRPLADGRAYVIARRDHYYVKETFDVYRDVIRATGFE